MGEKEQGAARDSSAPSVSERDAQSGKAAGITGDPDFDLARASTVKGSKSNSSERLASGDLSPDTDPADVAHGDAARVIKTRSNIQNNRGAAMTHEDDWESPASGMAGDPGDDDPPQSAINNSHSNIKNLRESTPRHSGEAGIAIDEPGVQ